MSTTIILTLIGIGVFAGILSGLVGVGGGIVMVPCLIYFMKFSPYQAQGTSLGVLILPVAFFAFISYYNKLQGTPEHIDYKIILFLALGFIAGGIAGGNLAVRIDQEILKKIFAGILFYTGIKLLGWDQIVYHWLKAR